MFFMRHYSTPTAMKLRLFLPTVLFASLLLPLGALLAQPPTPPMVSDIVPLGTGQYIEYNNTILHTCTLPPSKVTPHLRYLPMDRPTWATPASRLLPTHWEKATPRADTSYIIALIPPVTWRRSPIPHSLRHRSRVHSPEMYRTFPTRGFQFIKRRPEAELVIRS